MKPKGVHLSAVECITESRSINNTRPFEDGGRGPEGRGEDHATFLVRCIVYVRYISHTYTIHKNLFVSTGRKLFTVSLFHYINSLFTEVWERRRMTHLHLRRGCLL